MAGSEAYSRQGWAEVAARLRELWQAVVPACQTGLVTVGVDASQGAQTAEDDGFVRLSRACCGEWRLGGR